MSLCRLLPSSHQVCWCLVSLPWWAGGFSGRAWDDPMGRTPLLCLNSALLVLPTNPQQSWFWPCVEMLRPSSDESSLREPCGPLVNHTWLCWKWSASCLQSGSEVERVHGVSEGFGNMRVRGKCWNRAFLSPCFCARITCSWTLFNKIPRFRETESL